MDLQSPRLSKALSTLTAAVWFLPCVNSLMRSYPSQVRETPPAIRTGVRPLSSVNSAVNLKCPRLAETLAAVGAAIRSGTSVHVEVNAQIAVRVERSSTLGAEEAARFGCVLCSLVLQ